MDSYTQLWGVVRLPAVRKLAMVLLAFRLAVLPAEQAAPLKLLEKGVSKEALAGLVCPSCHPWNLPQHHHLADCHAHLQLPACTPELIPTLSTLLCCYDHGCLRSEINTS